MLLHQLQDVHNDQQHLPSQRGFAKIGQSWTHKRLFICLNPILEWGFHTPSLVHWDFQGLVAQSHGQILQLQAKLGQRNLGQLGRSYSDQRNWEVSRFHSLWGSIDLVRKSSAAHECQVSTWWLWIFCTDIARLPEICNFSGIGIKTCVKLKKCYIKELQPLQRVGSRRLHQKVDKAKNEGGTVQGNSDAKMMYFAYCNSTEILLFIDWATFDGWHQTSKNGIHFSSTRYQTWVTLPQNWDWTTNRIGTHMFFESPSKGAKLSANVLVRVPCKWYCQHLLFQKALESLVKEFGKLTSSHRLYPCLLLLPPLLHLKQGWAGRVLWVPNSIPASLKPKSSTSNKPANQTSCPSSPS